MSADRTLGQAFEREGTARCVAWFLSTPQGQALASSLAEALGASGIAHLARSTSAEQVGRAVMAIAPGSHHGAGHRESIRASPLLKAVNEAVAADPLGASLFPDGVWDANSDDFRAVGNAVIRTAWWEANKGEIARQIRHLKTVTEIMAR